MPFTNKDLFGESRTEIDEAARNDKDTDSIRRTADGSEDLFGDEQMPPHRCPFPHSYWVISGQLLAGEYPGSAEPSEARQKVAALVEVGIRRIVNLQEAHERNREGQLFAPYEDELRRMAARIGVQATMVRMPIRDMSVPTHEEMRTILDEIDRSIQQNLAVYVHCWGGHGRTGTVVGCYLARHGIASSWDAIRQIKSLRRGTPDAGKSSPQAQSQFDMVLKWKKGE